EEDILQIHRWDNCRAGNFRRRTETEPRDRTHHDEHRGRQPGTDCAKVMKPFADVQTHEIQCESGKETYRRRDDEVNAAIRQELPSVASYEQGVASGEIEDAGIIREIRGPIHPTRHETGKFPECFFAPQVHAALIRIPR